MAAGALSDAQETAIALACRVEVEDQCAGMIQGGTSMKLAESFAHGAITGFYARCKEMAAVAASSNDNPA